MDATQGARTFAGQFAVVTGASTGIGYELAKDLVSRGFDVMVTAETDDIEKAAREVGASQWVKADLATYDGVEKLYAKIKDVGRPVDAIAINAGVGVSGPFATETKLEDELNLINLNVTSAVHLAKRVSRDMVARGSGRMLITSSIAATMPGPFYVVYAASKAFLQSFAEGLRNELGDSGVSVTALMPGPTDTEFFARANMLDTPAGKGPKDDPALVARQGIDAMLEGKDSVVAGSFKNKVQAAVAKVLPEPTKAKMHRKQTEPEGRK